MTRKVIEHNAADKESPLDSQQKSSTLQKLPAPPASIPDNDSLYSDIVVPLEKRRRLKEESNILSED
jgi:hypothetical protein